MFDGGSVANALASRARTTDAVAIPGVSAWPTAGHRVCGMANLAEVLRGAPGVVGWRWHDAPK